jgi:hypothetical protein
MDFWIILVGIVGSVASVIGLFLPLQSKNQRIIHALYQLAIIAFAIVAVWYWQANQRVHKVEQAATRLLNNSNFDFTSEGFIQAALAFLEKNKDLYPDSYTRAQEICKSNHCFEPEYGKSGVNSLDHSYNQRNAMNALKGLILGISRLENGQ